MYTFSTKNNKNNKKSINDYFNPDFGFGKHKATAIELLRETIKILDESIGLIRLLIFKLSVLFFCACA